MSGLIKQRYKMLVAIDGGILLASKRHAGFSKSPGAWTHRADTNTSEPAAGACTCMHLCCDQVGCTMVSMIHCVKLPRGKASLTMRVLLVTACHLSKSHAQPAAWRPLGWAGRARRGV